MGLETTTGGQNVLLTRLDKIGVPTETERRQRMDLATVMMMTVRGIPIIYYGDEQYLALYDAPVGYEAKYINSGNDDPWNRPGMQSWDETTPAFRIISILAGTMAASTMCAASEIHPPGG